MVLIACATAASLEAITPPVLTAVSLSSASTLSPGSNATFSLGVTAGSNSIGSITLAAADPNGHVWLFGQVEAPFTSISWAISPNYINGTYAITSITVQDSTGAEVTYFSNGHIVYSEGLSGPSAHSLNFAALSFSVTGAVANYTSPQLQSVALSSAATLSAGSPVQYTFQIVPGSLSETFCYVQLADPDGNEYIVQGATLGDTASIGLPTDSTWIDGNYTVSNVEIADAAPAIGGYGDITFNPDGTITAGGGDSAQASNPVNFSALGFTLTGGATATPTPVPTPVVASVSATHSVAFVDGYFYTISSSIFYGGSPSRIDWQVTLPAGWQLISQDWVVADIQPSIGATGSIGWTWTDTLASNPTPIEFSYVVEAPFGASGPEAITEQVTVTEGGYPTSVDAETDPLMLDLTIYHSADTAHSNTITVSELTRVVSLYNTRSGTVLTGCYLCDTSSVDGFNPDPSRPSAAAFALPYYHSADYTNQGNITVAELTRVVSLYNYRAGTVLTGAYHVDGTGEDGFNPGP